MSEQSGNCCVGVHLGHVLSSASKTVCSTLNFFRPAEKRGQSSDVPYADHAHTIASAAVEGPGRCDDALEGVSTDFELADMRPRVDQ
jgi:hypothetical protein